MKRLLSALLLATVLTGLLCGCNVGKPKDEDLIARTATLLPMTAVINQLFYETGIPTDVSAVPVNGYRAADAAALSELGFTSLSDILAYMDTVWCDAYCTAFRKSALLTALTSGTAIGSYAYCYDGKDKDGNFTGLMVSEDGLPVRTDYVLEFLTDTLTVTKKAKKSAILSLSVRVKDRETGAEGVEETTVTLSLDTDGIWRLDSGTCMTYQQG